MMARLKVVCVDLIFLELAGDLAGHELPRRFSKARKEAVCKYVRVASRRLCDESKFQLTITVVETCGLQTTKASNGKIKDKNCSD